MNILTSKYKHTSMVIQTKSVFKYVYTETWLLLILYFDELGPCIHKKLKKYVICPWFSWNLVKLF